MADGKEKGVEGGRGETESDVSRLRQEGSHGSISYPRSLRQEGSQCSITDGESDVHEAMLFASFGSFSEWLDANKDTGFKSGVLFSEDMYRQAVEVLCVAPLPDTRATNQPGSSRFRHSIRTEKKWFLRHDAEGRPFIMGPGNKKSKEGDKGEDRTVVPVTRIEGELEKLHVDSSGKHLRKGPLDKAVRDKFIGISKLACAAFCFFCPVCSGKGKVEEIRRGQEQQAKKLNNEEGHVQISSSSSVNAQMHQEQETASDPKRQEDKKKRLTEEAKLFGGTMQKRQHVDVQDDDHNIMNHSFGGNLDSQQSMPVSTCENTAKRVRVDVGDGRFEEGNGSDVHHVEGKLHALWQECSERRTCSRETENELGEIASEVIQLRSSFEWYPAVHLKALALKRSGAMHDCVRLLTALTEYIRTGRPELFQGTQVTSPTESFTLDVE